MQAFADRRSFGKKDNAQQVLARFARRSRQEADLATVGADLVPTVQEAPEPERARPRRVRRP